MSVEIKTFGCRLNSYESDAISKLAAEAGLQDAIIFNSCAVTAEAERQLCQAVRRAKRNNPNSRIIVTGCAAQIDPEKYSLMPEVDLVLGNKEKTNPEIYHNLSKKISQKILVNDIMTENIAFAAPISVTKTRSRAFLEIQNGCNHRCTYCIIPYGRGNSRSLPFGAILDNARNLVEQGAQELVLTGVDITDYGLDLPGQPSLGQIIKRLLHSIPSLPRLRLSSIDVAEVDKHLLDLIAEEPRFMPHLHLSLQSGDHMILKRMKRRHTPKQVQEFCHTARLLRPDIAFGADIIAGFPTETEAMFRNTYDLLEACNIVYLHIFPYSERKGTPAARMPQVPPKIRKSRASLLRQLGNHLLQNHHKQQLGKQALVVVEEGGMAGRAENFTEIHFKNPVSEASGSIARVIIKSHDGHQVFGEITSNVA